MLDELNSRTLLDERCGYIILMGVSAIMDLMELKMRNFCRMYLSASYRKSKLRMHNFNEKHPHVIENVGCRCNCI